MAYDPEIHEPDAHTGLLRHKHTGRLVGIEHVPPYERSAPAATSFPEKPASPDYPKWVAPHETHVHRRKMGDHDHITTPHFTEHHVDRDTKAVTVLVHTPEEETKALTPFVKPAPAVFHEEDPFHD
jgi:hypothetical protein